MAAPLSEQLLAYRNPGISPDFPSGSGDASFISLGVIPDGFVDTLIRRENLIQVQPNYGFLISEGKWGASLEVGPCSAAIMTGMGDRIWFGHLQSGKGLPEGAIEMVEPHVRQVAELYIFGASDHGFGNTGVLRDAQIKHVRAQLEAAHLPVDIFVRWNTVPKSWLTVFVQSLHGRASVYAGFEG